MRCPKCNSEILRENINIQTDIAQCIKCENIFKISESIGDINDNFNIDDTPNGTWILKELDTITVGATTRSPIAFILVPFMIIWSGLSIGGIYGSQIINGEFNLASSLLGIPFLIGSIFFWSIALMAIWGKVELVLDKNGGRIFTGLGKIGLTKSFVWNDITTIKEVQSSYNFPSNTSGKITLEGKRRISFGLGVTESRRYYLIKVLKRIHSNVKTNRRF